MKKTFLSPETSCVIILILVSGCCLLAVPTLAQDFSEGVVPSNLRQQTSMNLPDSPFPKQVVTPCPLSDPNCGETSLRDRNEFNAMRRTAGPHQRTADKKFWLVISGLAASTTLHILAVSRCRHTVGVESCEGEYGPFRTMQGLNIGLSAGMAAIGYGWKKTDDEDGAKRSHWWVIPVGTAAFMGATAIQQYRKHCPVGAHFNGDECS